MNKYRVSQKLYIYISGKEKLAKISYSYKDMESLEVSKYSGWLYTSI